MSIGPSHMFLIKYSQQAEELANQFYPHLVKQFCGIWFYKIVKIPSEHLLSQVSYLMHLANNKHLAWALSFTCTQHVCHVASLQRSLLTIYINLNMSTHRNLVKMLPVPHLSLPVYYRFFNDGNEFSRCRKMRSH